MMGRYLVFCADHYYPCGGVRDLVAITDNYDEAKKWIEKCREHFSFGQILDLETGKIEEYKFEDLTGEPIDEKHTLDVNEIISENRELYFK